MSPPVLGAPRSILLALTAALAACSPPPAPPELPKVVEAPKPPPPPAPPSRWFVTSAPTMIGPTTQAGTLVLLGGRRALVAPDGTVTTETHPSPEPLLDLIEVPTERETVLIARGEHAIYRLAEPLGAPVELARSSSLVTHIGAGPGLLVAWGERHDVPKLLDLKTGQEAKLAPFSPLPLRAVAFLDTKRGAAIFEGAGLALTSDGGATWKLAGDANKGDAARMGGLRRVGGALRAFAFAEGPDAPIDFAKGSLGPLEQPVQPEKEPPLLRWVRITGRDPLEAAATSGVVSPEGPIIASHGLAARVDPQTGVVTEVTQFAKGQYMSPCNVVSAGTTAWIGCALSETAVPDMFDPWGVASVSVVGGALHVDKPAIIRNGEAEVRASASGGVMLMGACNQQEEGEACVRQPNGEWKTVRVNGVEGLDVRTLGPLADGRVAGLRAPGEVAPGATPRWSIVILQQTAVETTIELDFTLEPDSVLFDAPIEEEKDHGLRLTGVSADSGFVFRASAKPEAPAVPVRVPGASSLRVHGVHGVAVADGKVMVSLDGGGTWTAAAPPKNAFSGGALGVTGIDLSDVGTRVAEWARFGWGPEAPEAVEAPTTKGADLTFASPAAAPEPILNCTTDGTTQDTPILIGTVQLPLVLGSKPPTTKGDKRDTSSWTSGQSGMLGTVAFLEEDGKDAQGSKPDKWTIKWLDGAAIGDKPHAWSGPPPKDAAWRTDLLGATASGNRAFFGLRTNRKVYVLRVKGGKGDLAELPVELGQTFDSVAFGSDKGEPIVWWAGNTLVAWLSGEAPRAIGKLAGRGLHTLGEPTKDGVPVVLSGPDWSVSRTFALSGTPSLTLDGWTRAPSFVRDVTTLPACGADSKTGSASGPLKPKGARFLLAKPRSSPTRIDGRAETSVRAQYDVRVDGDSACVAATATLLRPERVAPRQPEPGKDDDAKKKKPAKDKDTGPIAFLRVDWLGKKAEGGDQGAPPATLRRFKCTLDPK